MASIPTNGQEAWGNSLREYLGVSHDTNGTLKRSALAGKNMAAKMYLSANQSLSANALTTVKFDTDDFDTDDITDTSAYKITPTIAGYYLVTWSIIYAPDWTPNRYFHTIIYKNTGIAAQSGIDPYSNAYSSVNLHTNGSTVLYLNGTDYIQAKVKHNDSDRTPDLLGGETYNTNMSIIRIF